MTTLAVLVPIIGVFIRAAVSQTRSQQKNTDAIDRLTGTINAFQAGNEKDHDRFSDKLENHEHRITVLEKSPGGS